MVFDSGDALRIAPLLKRSERPEVHRKQPGRHGCYRLESAVTRARARELLNSGRTQEAFSKFEILERRADFAEGRAEALGMSSLEDEIHELRAAEAVDRELEAMKAALRARVQ